MAKYQRIKGGEKNEKTGLDWTREELEEVCELYLEINGKNIHENNPKIHLLAEKIGRTVRSVENQLLGFKKVESGDIGRKNYNSLIPEIWSQRFDKQKDRSSDFLNDFSPSTDNDFRFRISSQLKNILGKDLILNDNIALFELVKNSYDAHATNVKIVFDENKITIWDDGKGMSREDLINKWLFVAYSAKKNGEEDVESEGDSANYRDKISFRQSYAGAKGIGRFSTDRIGSKLILTTRDIRSDSLIFDQLLFDWDIFENDGQNKFNEINIPHKTVHSTAFNSFEHGLILEISDLRNAWTFTKILELKRSLEKLINPFQSSDSNLEFNIEIIAPRYVKEDELQENPRNKINGLVNNFVFDTLGIKTTQIISTISVDGETITTELIDRGQLIYKIQEKNQYRYLSNIDCNLYYLNTTAKYNFTSLMGIRQTQFGSIFLFNKGFRVSPIGDPDNDPFNINKRKNQGRSRFLGTRELIGRIEIKSTSDLFVETTSREGGLIDSPGTLELERFFIYTVLSRLEKYVVDIQWPIKDQSEDLSLLSVIENKSKIIGLVNRLVDSDNITLLDYSKDFFDVINEKNSVSTPEIFDHLRSLAEKSGDLAFANEIDLSKLEFIKIKKEKEQEEEKRKEAEKSAQLAEVRRKEEEDKRKEAEKRAIEAEETKKQREGQVKFYQSVQTLDIVEVQNLHHQIIIDAGTIETSIQAFKNKLNKNDASKDEINGLLEEITLAYKKILAVAKFTTKENFLSANRSIVGDIPEFLSNYLNAIYKFHTDNKLKITVDNPQGVFFETTFKPIELTIIIDNLLSNSKKKNANNVTITIEKIEKNLKISFKDDGDGLDKTISSSDIIFERGFTTTRGSGIGLFHVKQIMNEEFNGDISVNNRVNKGIEFILTFNKL